MTGRSSHSHRSGGPSWSGHGDCPSGKWTYSDRATAKAWSRKTAHSGNTKKQTKQRPYRCEMCGHWHLGHKPDATMRGEISSRELHEQHRRATG